MKEEQQHTKLDKVNDILLDKLYIAIEKDNFDDAQKLAHIFSMLPE